MRTVVKYMNAISTPHKHGRVGASPHTPLDALRAAILDFRARSVHATRTLFQHVLFS
jgi:hypothetical protein